MAAPLLARSNGGCFDMPMSRSRVLRFGLLASVALPAYQMRWLYDPWSYGFPVADSGHVYGASPAGMALGRRVADH